MICIYLITFCEIYEIYSSHWIKIKQIIVIRTKEKIMNTKLLINIKLQQE